MRRHEEGKRSEWTFRHKGADLAKAASDQSRFREERIAFWKAKHAEAMALVRDSGIEVQESMAGHGYGNKTMVDGPRVLVRADLQAKLTECHGKIGEHQTAKAEYDGWVQVLSANPHAELDLTHADWLYFFGK